jgi:hypothetical protein
MIETTLHMLISFLKAEILVTGLASPVERKPPSPGTGQQLRASGRIHVYDGTPLVVIAVIERK